MQTLSTTKWCYYAVVLGQRDKDTFRKIPVWLNRLLCKPHVWRVCKAYKLFFPSERDCKLWYPSLPPFQKKQKQKQKQQNNADCYPGRRYISTYCKVYELHLMATFAKCDLLKFFSMKKKKKKRFILVVLPVSSGFPRVVSRSSYSLWWLYIWCCLARWQLIGA